MNQFRARLIFISIIFVLGGMAIVTRLFTIQVLDSKRYVERSKDQTQQRLILTANRGNILDRNCSELATSIENDFVVNSQMTGIKLSNEKQSVKRVYPIGEIGGSVLGYIGADGYGLGGVEFIFDNYLRGEDGWIILQKDGRNHKYRKIGLPVKEPRKGYDVVLTIDSKIQKIVHAALKKSVTVLNAKGGMCIVMDPKNGKVFAMANEPSFNPNHASSYPLDQRKNKCISYVYEPGSTFKLITAAAALQEKCFKEDDLLYGDNGVFRIYDQMIRDHSPFGYLTFSKALSYSSNVCFAKIASKIGNKTMFNYTRNFGFGTKTGIDLPGEEEGILHPVRSWSGRTLVTMAIGQEISSTLLQMVLPFAAVANGGILINPLVYEKIVDNRGDIIDSAECKVVRRVLSEQVAARLRIMLKDVVENGTGKNARIEGITVAGKTGTSQKPDSGTYSQTSNWSSFIGFAPVENPLLLCGVVIDEPAGGEMGGAAAAPVFRNILTQIISHPDLEFAQKILKNKPVPVPDKNRHQRLPVLCGKTRREAESLLDSLNIKYEFSGNGNHVVFHLPAEGYFIDKSEKLVLYTDKQKPQDGQMKVPDCIGKDLRDAINLISIEGFKPFAIGCGIVKKQTPIGGSVVRSTEICTLYCSFES
jgi:cell division protein FtsI/penicillin-binding protein 2